MGQRKTKRLLGKATLLSVVKEMAKPRLAASVREELDRSTNATALKEKRDGLMIRYRQNPIEPRLAMEIQSLTDEIARLENPPPDLLAIDRPPS